MSTFAQSSHSHSHSRSTPNDRPSSSSSAMLVDDDDEDREVEQVERIWKDKLNAMKAELTEICRQGNVAKALMVAKKIFEMEPTDKADRKVQKLQELLEQESEEEGDVMVEVCRDFHLFKDLYQKLYPYQLEGVKWMWWLYNKRKGGILGDDMGLGKTIQVIAYLSGMFDANRIQTVLVVMPLSLITNWSKEFDKWAPGINVYHYYGSKREREQCLAKVRRRGGVLLTTYGLLVTTNEDLGEQNKRLYTWDYVILDEGHKIKTSTTKTSRAAHSIPARNRLVLSGTPLQNNLKEMWALFDFVHHGTLLGTFRTFRCEYDVPITRARAKDATPSEKKLGLEIADSLRTLIQPYFLRRTKAEVLENPTGSSVSNCGVVPNLVRKNELVVWLFMSDAQQKIYSSFLMTEEVRQILMTKHSPLVQLTVLKKICDHPRLLSRRNCIKLGLEGEGRVNDNEDELDEDTYKMCIDHVTDNDLIRESGKLMFLMELVKELERTGHRVLIFSQSRKMLDIVERLLSQKFKYLRIDGTVSNPQDRQSRITKFQKDSSITVFLLTTQVGGVGLTLTGADRVIIYDPSWNPATDAQAVDRVYRIGQSKPVVVYRLITCGTVEEKIYRRQIFKDSLTRQTTGDSKNPYRYFTKEELRSLFVLENPYSSQTQIQLEEMHGNQRITDAELDEHLAFLMSLNIFGLSDHDLMFKCVEEDEALNDPTYMGQIKMQVEKAKEMVRKDAEQLEKINKEGGNLQYREYTQENAKKRLGGGGGETPYLSPELLAAMGADMNDLQRYYDADDKENVQWLSAKPKPNDKTKKLHPTAPPLMLPKQTKEPEEETILISDTPDVTPSSSFRKNESDIVLIEDSESDEETNLTDHLDRTVLDDDASNAVIEDSFEKSPDKTPPIDEGASANPELDVSLQNLSAKGCSDEWFKDCFVEPTQRDKTRKRRSVAAGDLRHILQPIQENLPRRQTMNTNEIKSTTNLDPKSWQPYASGSIDIDSCMPSSPCVADDNDVVEMVDVSDRQDNKKQMRLSLSRRSSSSASELRRGLKAFHQPSIADFLRVSPKVNQAMDVGSNEKAKLRRRSVATPASRRQSRPLVNLDLNSDDDDDFKPNISSVRKVSRPVLSEEGEISLISSDDEPTKSASLCSSRSVNDSSEEDASTWSSTEAPSPHSGRGIATPKVASEQFRNRGVEVPELAQFTPLRLPSKSDRSSASQYSSCSNSQSNSPTSPEYNSRNMKLSSSEEKSFDNSYSGSRSSYVNDEDSPMVGFAKRNHVRMVIDSDSD